MGLRKRYSGGNVRIALAKLLDLAIPPRCPLCGEGITAQVGLCAACWGELAIPGEPSCRRCQRPFPDGMTEGAICAPCLASPPRHDGIAAGTLYNDAARKLVLRYKHGGHLALAPMMARLVAARFSGPLAEVGEGWLWVPVPLHRWRLWQRGFNQSAVLAGALARLRGGGVLVDGLLRKKHTPVLGGLGRKARARVLSGAIAINPAHAARIRGARVVLVDDVLTSGATTDVCVSALKRAGAASVVIACFSRVLDEALEHGANENARG